MSGPLPRSIDDLTAGWLRPVLARAGLVDREEPVRAEAERIGADRSFTGAIARVTWASLRAPDRTGTLIAKLPDAAANFERCAREVHFFRELAATCGLTVPRIRLAAMDEASRAVVLLMDDVPGVPGDAATGCSADEAAAVVTAMARMHARWHDDPRVGAARPDWLPRWGRGAAGAPDPHRRRAERYRRRRAPFLARFGAAAPRGLAPLTEELAGRLEPLLARVASLTPTLIHADLHLDNVIFAPRERWPGVTVLDWQSVSAGPGLYDLALFLTGSLQGAAAHRAIPDLCDLYFARLRVEGAAPLDLDAAYAAFREVALCVLAGFVSGYGGRDPGTLVERELELIRVAMSPAGLAGAVLRIVTDA